LREIDGKNRKLTLVEKLSWGKVHREIPMEKSPRRNRHGEFKKLKRTFSAYARILMDCNDKNDNKAH
jgi:hypothetical protein